MAQARQFNRRTEKTQDSAAKSVEFLFGKKNFIIIGAGIFCILLGFILMSGGKMPSPDVWDESIIYSFRRITLAPILILIGLGLQVYAIFVKKS